MIICSCNVLTDHDVRSAAKTQSSAKSARAVYGCLGCSAQCGRCARTIRKILKQAEPNPFPSTRNRFAPLLGPDETVIDQILIDDETAPPKQRYTCPSGGTIHNRPSRGRGPRPRSLVQSRLSTAGRPAELGHSAAGGIADV